MPEETNTINQTSRKKIETLVEKIVNGRLGKKEMGELLEVINAIVDYKEQIPRKRVKSHRLTNQTKVYDIASGRELRHYVLKDSSPKVIARGKKDHVKTDVMASHVPTRQIPAIVFPLRGRFTTAVLQQTVLPYIKAMEEMQGILNAIKKAPNDNFHIRFITSSSPIKASLEGAADVYKAIRDDVSEWRAEHAQTMSELEERAFEADIKSKQGALLESVARATKDEAEAAKTSAEAEKIKAEAAQIRQRTEADQFMLQKQRYELAESIVKKADPKIKGTDLIARAMSHLPALNTLAASDVSTTVLLLPENDK